MGRSPERVDTAKQPVMTRLEALLQAARQSQFLEVISPDEATRRFHARLRLEPLGIELVALDQALGRVIAATIQAPVDVPAFDRATVDGFAIQAAASAGAHAGRPAVLTLNAEVLTPGLPPRLSVGPGNATPIATGGMLPRGADAVVMIEQTELLEGSSPRIAIVRPAVAGQFVAFAGTDIARGETLLRSGQVLGSRELGLLAAVGLAEVAVWRRPRVAILSTGDEIVAPGQALRLGAVYDSNAAILAAAVQEQGGEPVPLGIIADDETALDAALAEALQQDLVILSGGTSKGAGDVTYRCLKRLGEPGIVVHGVALKPGKPICLAVHQGKPVIALPGFPTSAIFTFHEFVAPVLRRYAGLALRSAASVKATAPVALLSERGRTEYVMVSLIATENGLAAYPIGKGSGSVTTFSFADGFIAIDQRCEVLPAGSEVSVQLLTERVEPADLVVIGSQCAGLDLLLSRLKACGFTVKSLYVGSHGGVQAAGRGECDIAGVHLLDPVSRVYNRHLLTPELRLLPGYKRLQGIVFRAGDARFEGRTPAAALTAALADPDCLVVNRNAGSGTRILLDHLLEGRQPPGYAVQPKSHHAVAAAVASGRADWGLAIAPVARLYGLGFIPVQDEHYDFLVPVARWERPAVKALRALLADAEVRRELAEMGLFVEEADAVV